MQPSSERLPEVVCPCCDAVICRSVRPLGQSLACPHCHAAVRLEGDGRVTLQQIDRNIASLRGGVQSLQAIAIASGLGAASYGLLHALGAGTIASIIGSILAGVAIGTACTSFLAK